MPKHRRSKEQLKKDYIKKYIVTSKEVCAGFSSPEEAKKYHSNGWFDQFYLMNNNYNRNELLSPKREPLRFAGGISSANLNSKLIGYNGFWRIAVHPRSRKSLDFDIAVMAGSVHRFHSEVIKYSIISRHGKSTYDQWRKIIKDDIHSLTILVNAFKSRLMSVPWSYSCSQSSANLCEQVGITTHRGTAFLFPDSFA